MGSKIMDMWEISREREKEFIKDYLKNVDEIEVHDLFKMIRGSEYRRGKTDKIRELKEHHCYRHEKGGCGKCYSCVNIFEKHVTVPQTSEEVTWLCDCGYINYILNERCLKCDKPQKPEEVKKCQ